MTAIQMKVSTTVKDASGKGQREEVGAVELFAPTLQELGLAYEPKEQDKETNELVYEDRTAQFLYNAIVAAVKANARNKFLPGTVDLRPGATLPSNLEELVAPTVSNKGQALAELRTLKEMFKEFATGLAKPDAIKQALIQLFGSESNLSLMEASKRAKIKPYFEEFGNAVAERLTDWQVNYINGILEACDKEDLAW